MPKPDATHSKTIAVNSASDSSTGWRPYGWLAGLPVVALLCAAAISVLSPDLTDGLSSGADSIARDTREGTAEPWLRYQVSGRDLMAFGEAPNEAVRKQAAVRLDELPGLRRVIDRMGLIEQASPFVLTAVLRQDDYIDVSGHRPAELARSDFARRLVAVLPARLGLRDASKSARGAPEGFIEAAAFAIVQLGDLKSGAVVSVSDTVIRLRGDPISAAAAERLRARASAPPSGFRVETGSAESAPDVIAAAPKPDHGIDPAPPPAQESGMAASVAQFTRIRREPGKILIEGQVPSAAVRESLLAAIRARFLHELVSDGTVIAPGAAKDLVAALTVALDHLATLSSGEVVATDRDLRLEGESLYTQNAAQLEQRVPSALPKGWTSAISVKARGALVERDKAVCARQFSEILSGRRLSFAVGSSQLKSEFYPVLDAIAALARQCSDQRFEVVGHTDPGGKSEAAPLANLAIPAKDKPAKPQPPAAGTKTNAKTGTKSEPKTDAKAAQKGPPAKPVSVASAGSEAEKAAAAQTSSVTVTPEPELDLPRMRAQAIVDYLIKAGVSEARAAIATAASPQSDRQGIAITVRS